MPQPPFSNNPGSQSLSRSAVLLTGFGPFPGVTDNASARLALATAVRGRREFSGYNFHATILPTEWARAPERLTALLNDLRPVLALHFGVTREARGFRIETLGRNVCRNAADAAGVQPQASHLIRGAPAELSTNLPVAAIAKRLEALGHPVSISDDAGRYICNAVLYRALHHADQERHPCRVGFVHVPVDLAGPPLTFAAAVDGSLEIIRTCLDCRQP